MGNKLVLVHTAPGANSAPQPRARVEDPWADDKLRQLGILQQAAVRAAECLLDVLHPDNFRQYTPVEQAQISLQVLKETGAIRRMKESDDAYKNLTPATKPELIERKAALGATLRDLTAKLPLPELKKGEDA